MPALHISPDLEMHYRVDDYTDPWRDAQTILLLHGNGEHSVAWFGWVPTLARHFRVIRPDMRGFGNSTVMPRDFPWTLDTVIDDFIRLMDALGVQRFHLVGAKLGGTVARAMAARRAERVLTLTLAGTPPPLRAHTYADMNAQIGPWERGEHEQSLRKGMKRRLGSAFAPDGVEWWSKLMNSTPVSTQIGFIAKISYVDITADLPRIKCPTLVITTERSERATLTETRAWQQAIPNSALLVLLGDSDHVAASDPDACAQATIQFISESKVA